jgi:hypothetical protein
MAIRRGREAEGQWPEPHVGPMGGRGFSGRRALSLHGRDSTEKKCSPRYEAESVFTQVKQEV